MMTLSTRHRRWLGGVFAAALCCLTALPLEAAPARASKPARKASTARKSAPAKVTRTAARKATPAKAASATRTTSTARRRAIARSRAAALARRVWCGVYNEHFPERVVTFDGNRSAQALLEEVFQVTDRVWRGIGTIPQSGWRLSDAYRDFDAEPRFDVGGIRTQESPLCKAGEVLQGATKPNQCPAFGKECTPRTPLGATMVSTEGACAASPRVPW